MATIDAFFKKGQGCRLADNAKAAKPGENAAKKKDASQGSTSCNLSTQRTGKGDAACSAPKNRDPDPRPADKQVIKNTRWHVMHFQGFQRPCKHPQHLPLGRVHLSLLLTGSNCPSGINQHPSSRQISSRF